MRIEILISGSDEPQIYPLNKPKITLGSGETCDIVISSENVSRKHLQILIEGDSYFVVDQGSTNGSYINEERLVPGRRTEFTSFFPVRLGDQVLITLLSDDEPGDSQDEPLIPLYPKDETPVQGRSSDESTKMISLGDLKKAKTSDLVQKRKEVIKKRAAPAAAKKKAPVKSKRAKENQRFKFLLYTFFIGLAAIGYYNYKNREEEVPVARMGEIVPAKQDAKAADVAATAPEAPKIVPEDQLIPKERYPELLADLKCITDLEKYFCEKIPGLTGTYGAVQIGSTMNILLNGGEFVNEARQFVGPFPEGAPQEEIDKYFVTLTQAALALFVMKGFPQDLEWEKLKDLKIAIALFEEWDGKSNLHRVLVAYPEQLKEFKGLIGIKHFQNIKQLGDLALKFSEEYYRTY